MSKNVLKKQIQKLEKNKKKKLKNKRLEVARYPNGRIVIDDRSECGDGEKLVKLLKKNGLKIKEIFNSPCG